MRQPGSRKRCVRIEPEELRARVLNWGESYFFSRASAGEETFVDDEASIEVEAFVEKISKRHRKHQGERMRLPARKWTASIDGEQSTSRFSLNGSWTSHASVCFPPRPATSVASDFDLFLPFDDCPFCAMAGFKPGEKDGEIGALGIRTALLE